MLGRIKDILLGVAQKPEENAATSGEGDGKREKVAICALLLEIANFDGDFHDEEKRVIIDIVKNDFDLTADEADELIEESERELKGSIDLWHFTKIINQKYSKSEKIQLLEMLWKVVYADGKLHGHEDHLIHKLASLLKLEHKDLINAKISAK